MLDKLTKKIPGIRKRESSYDRTGGNDDRYHIRPGEVKEFFRSDKPGRIEHIWITISNAGFSIEKNALRKSILRFYWDGEENPSIEVPIGDFFGMGHAKTHNYSCALFSMSPNDGLGMNCWLPMPYEKARITVENNNQTELILYFYVDYRELDDVNDEPYRLHAQWRRECPTKGKQRSDFETPAEYSHGGCNVTGEDNYLIMEAKGEGHYIGCHLDFNSYNDCELWDWPGEGDDMIFIDGDKLPTLNGTGTEDYFCMAWCPNQEYNSLYQGLIVGTDKNWKGENTYYRYHVTDPINFSKDIRVTIEHGHANHRCDDFTSVGYWYQKEPHMPLPPMLPVEERMPLDLEKTREIGKVVLQDHRVVK